MPNKNPSLYIYNAAGELDTRVFFSDGETPDYDAPHWLTIVQDGIVLKVDPAAFAGKVDPIPQNFNGKPVHHDLDKLLLPDIAKVSQKHADALQANIDQREIVWAAEAQAVADAKAKMDSFVASLSVTEKQRLDAIDSKQAAIDFYNSLPPDKQAVSPIKPP